ncbi:MAG: hypothetical protein ABIC40_01395, partial [bacterium]
MKNIKLTYLGYWARILTLAIILTLLAFPLGSSAKPDLQTKEDFAGAFDEVARNFGAMEYATYTFMLEMRRPPISLDELRESGHLNVLMTNPYTDGEVISVTKDDLIGNDLAGNVYFEVRDDNHESYIEVFFVRLDPKPTVHSMVKRIFIFFSQPDHDYLFGNDLTREEQFTAVYCYQAIDAIECFEQRNGRTPENFDDMYENGDVNVHYINPITGELAVSSEELSPGNYYYKKIGEDGYLFIGWGKETPVFLGTTDQDEENRFYEQWP